MQKTLALAARGKGKTSPNPMVGAIIVKKGKIVAQGYHKKAGTPHAEIVALKKAGPLSKGATLFVNLEPCCHTDKRTPPCTKSIIESGIRKVVVAMIDPNPKVAGMGMRELRRAGIKTEVGIMRAEAKKLNEAFIKFITKKEPFVFLKIAQTIDGKIATAAGNSQWITGTKSREYVHRLRNDVDALLVGIGTVKKDNPSLDCRLKGGMNPFRIIVDSSLRIPLDAKLLNHKDGRTIIATTEKAHPTKISRLTARGARVLVIDSKHNRVDLRKLIKELGRLDITSVMIEGGSTVNASALSSGIVDKVLFFIAPKIIGGTDSLPSIGGKSPALLKSAYGLKHLISTAVGDDLLIEGYL